MGKPNNIQEVWLRGLKIFFIDFYFPVHKEMGRNPFQT
jgi:hypothetical protein